LRHSKYLILLNFPMACAVRNLPLVRRSLPLSSQARETKETKPLPPRSIAEATAD
jgi:hypothetical protein